MRINDPDFFEKRYSKFKVIQQRKAMVLNIARVVLKQVITSKDVLIRSN